MRRKSINLTLGLLMFFAGAGALGGAAMVSLKAWESYPTKGVDQSSSFSGATREQCITAASGQQFLSHFKDPGGLIVNEPGNLLKPRESLFRASLVLSQCPGYSLSEFCYGSSCEGKGLTMTLLPTKSVDKVKSTK